MNNEYKNGDEERIAKEQPEEPLTYIPEPPPVKPEKHDLPIMMCSAYLVLLPVCVVVILLICLVGYFFIARGA